MDDPGIFWTVESTAIHASLQMPGAPIHAGTTSIYIKLSKAMYFRDVKLARVSCYEALKTAMLIVFLHVIW